MTIKELKKFASTLADVSPKTEMEIVRLCKKVVLGLYELTGPEAIEELYAQLATKENKQYMHKVTMQVQVQEHGNGPLIFYVPTHDNTLFTLDTFKTYVGTKIPYAVYIGDTLDTIILNGRFGIFNNVTKLYVTLSCIDTTTGHLRTYEKEYDLEAITSFTDTLI